MRQLTIRVCAMLGTAGALTVLLYTPLTAQKAAASCNEPMADANHQVRMQDAPFFPVVTKDGCWLLVTTGSQGVPGRRGVAVLERRGGVVRETGFFALDSPLAMHVALTPDQRTLIVGGFSRAVFLDVAKLTSGDPAPMLGQVTDHRFSGNVTLMVTPDGRHVFVGNTLTDWVSVIDIEKARRDGFNAEAIVGGFAAGPNIGLTLAPDGKHLYVSTFQATEPKDGNGKRLCLTPNPTGRELESSIHVVDLARALNREPPIVASVRGSCDGGDRNPAVSADGTRLYEEAQEDDTILVFDTSGVGQGLAPKPLARIPAGGVPVGIKTLDRGKRIVVATADGSSGPPVLRGGRAQLTVLDAAKVATGIDAVVATIPAEDPRGIMASADERTLFVTNPRTRTLQIIDLERMPVSSVPQPSAIR